MSWMPVLEWIDLTKGFSLLISFSSGFLIGATEIISTFQYRKKLFKTPSFWIFLILHGFLGSAAFIVIALKNPAYWQNPLIALAAGVAPHVFLRSRFTLLRSRDEKGDKKLDVGLDLEKVYNTWIGFIKSRIDMSSMRDRRKMIDMLINRYSTPRLMRDEVVKMLYTRQAINEKERIDKIAEVDKIYQSAEDIHDEICLYKLANFILDNSDFDKLSENLSTDKILREARADERTPPSSVENFLKNNPNFLMDIEQYKENLLKEDWAYLHEKIILSDLTAKGKAKAAAKFLYKRGKIILKK